LSQNCRAAKETLLQTDASEESALSHSWARQQCDRRYDRTELAFTELEATLVDGFFPHCAPSDLPKSGRRGGFQEMGLPYAADPGVMRISQNFSRGNGR